MEQLVALRKRVAALEASATDRGRTGDAAPEGEEGPIGIALHSAALEAAANAIFITDYKGVIKWVNPAFVRITGYTAEEAVGQNARILNSGRYDRAFYRDLWETILSGHVWRGGLINRKKDGSFYATEQTITPLADEAGEVTDFIAIMQDVTKQRRIESALRASEATSRALVSAIPDMMFRIRGDGTYLEFLPAPESDPYGLSEVFMGKQVRDAMPQELAEQTMLDIAQVLESGGIRVREYALPLGDEERSYEYRMVPSGEDEVLVIVRDVTERKKAENVVRESRERLRNLAARLHSVREEERTLLARELHDELGQALTGLRMDLFWLIDRLPEHDGQLHGRARAMVALVDGTVDVVRRISSSLRPAILDDLGLEAAIEWQVLEFQGRTKVACKLEVDGGERALESARATTVFRILQEALTNVARHAGAKHVDVNLWVSEEQLMLAVRDDGKGIADDELTSPSALGLIGMRERAGAHGGRVVVSQPPEGGTQVLLKLPLCGMATV